MNKPQKIRWLIAHEPINLFLRTANAFKSKIAELTDNQIEVEIFTPSEYAKSYQRVENENNNKIVDPMVSMEAGLLEMSQLHITELAIWHSPDFFALELPFIFRDHEHAATVLEGPIGQKMLGDLKDRSPAQGLAFTYSGGFRCIVADNEVVTLADLKDQVYAIASNPVSHDMVESIGAVPKSFKIKDFFRHAGRTEGFNANVLETTIPRYLALYKDQTNKRYMINTKHSLFLTSIIVSNKFWASLDQDTQNKFNEACLYASRLERQWSVEDAENFSNKKDHSDIGVTYHELSKNDTAEFKKLTQPVVDKYKDFFTAGLVDGIIRS